MFKKFKQRIHQTEIVFIMFINKASYTNSKLKIKENITEFYKRKKMYTRTLYCLNTFNVCIFPLFQTMKRGYVQIVQVQTSVLVRGRLLFPPFNGLLIHSHSQNNPQKIEWQFVFTYTLNKIVKLTEKTCQF